MSAYPIDSFTITIESDINDYFQDTTLFSDEKKHELDCRSIQIDNGLVETIPWEVVQSEIAERYGI